MSTRPPLVTVAITLLTVLAGCGATSRTDLLDDLAVRVDRSGDLTFTAEYRLPGGSTAVLAQAQGPPRAAYIRATRRTVVTDRRTVDCRTDSGGTACTVAPPPSANTEPALDVVAAAGRGTNATLVSPRTAVRMASAASLRGTVVTRHEATVAGQPSTCFGVPGSAGFSACVTDGGVLASFSGTVDGTAVDLTLTRFTGTVDPTTFDLPPGATIR